MPNTREKLIELLSQAQDNGIMQGNHVTHIAHISNQTVADHLIAHGVTVQSDKDINVPTKWISVKDRLPMMDKVGEFVLAYTREKRHIIVTCWAVHKHRDQIIAWQPLPQPPKGE